MPKVEEKIVITSAFDVQHHFDSLTPFLQLIESEDSWQKIEKSLLKLEVITKSGGYKHDNFITLFKSVTQPIINSLLSERTKLSGTAADLLNSVAPRLGERFESLLHVFAPTLLLICARTNKIALVRAKKCLLLIAKHCKLPSLLTHLRDASKDKSQTMRVVSVEVTFMLLEAIDSKERIGKRVADIETIIRGTATDRDPEVRQWSKRVFELYVDWWSERVIVFTSSFTPTTRRYLALPKMGLATSTKTVAPKTIATPFKRVEPSEGQHTSIKAGPSRKVSQTHLTTKETSNSTQTSVSTSTNYMHHSTTSRAQGTRVPSNPSSSSSSTSRGTQSAINVTEAKQFINITAVESDLDRKRAALKAEILKQATGTPSQSIAARLALEQIDFQFRKSHKSGIAEEQKEEVGVQRQTDRALFNIAMAKKKQSPTKGPGRIIVAAPLSKSTSQRTLSNGASKSKPAQRIVSTASSTSSLSCMKGKGTVEEEEEPDVFRSRPIERVGNFKMTSSISRGLSAREKLLKSSSLKATSSPNSNRGIKSGQAGLNARKKGAEARLKVDIGKENIPPNSKLTLITQTATPDVTRSRIAPSVLIASSVVATEASNSKTVETELKHIEDQTEIKGSKEEEEEKEVGDALESVLILEEETLADFKVEEEDRKAPQSVKNNEPLEPSYDIKSSLVSQSVSPLEEWKVVANSLPIIDVLTNRGDPIPHSATSIDHHSLDIQSSPPVKVDIPPFLSSPARKTLGEIHQNIISPLSLSSPLSGKVQQKVKSTAAVGIPSTSIPSPLIIPQATIVKEIKSKQRPLILAVSRKI